MLDVWPYPTCCALSLMLSAVVHVFIMHVSSCNWRMYTPPLLAATGRHVSRMHRFFEATYGSTRYCPTGPFLVNAYEAGREGGGGPNRLPRMSLWNISNPPVAGPKMKGYDFYVFYLFFIFFAVVFVNSYTPGVNFSLSWLLSTLLIQYERYAITAPSRCVQSLMKYTDWH